MIKETFREKEIEPQHQHWAVPTKRKMKRKTNISTHRVSKLDFKNLGRNQTQQDETKQEVEILFKFQMIDIF